ncbi:RNA polymerase sigma factor [Glycomyces algeriensis]|uniref:DNA-directed RNA polymerase sigma-70 factor n=1 Tax=Glycomyces algeriensis TaxID=256037 RepID=A0A9W6LFM8_9ACTN|nr:sigma-70 family RNA polymerase sigma factor [Glycomyces algeriensis]MDA1366144.1 sigma-70 family RNA polymerase sigma factor [Glycomyces algeriensis]MDR7349088.1 RNA polymerase sigma factor (sigma-70 family) [Glycomyces algeriensis]GLI41788.1 DNA-directed RNA polymerase sigma-70 factor [Glycomyces algeriensis]
MNATSAHSVAAVDYDRRAQLYLAARAGDGTAQQALVRELNELLWRAARRTGLDRESASDVVQTAWLRLWHIEKELEQPRALTKWLLTTVSREAWKQIGHMRREVVADPIDLREEVTIEGIEDGLVRDVEREAVRRAFLAQTERCRRLLAFVATVARPDYDVIAEALGMKRGSIGPTRGRCLDKLRRTLLDDPSWSGGEERDEHAT